jgi:hypothetical protein
MKRALTDNVVVSKACLFSKNKNKSFFSPMVLDFRKIVAFWKIPWLSIFVLRVRQSVDKDEYGVLVE